LSPFRHLTFTVLWIATVIANIGSWMQSAAAAWLMTGLNPDPLVVALVQVASTLPMFLFALPGGALADLVDRRRLLITIQTTVVVLVAFFGVLVSLNRVTPALLLGFTFLAGTAAALIAPAWQSIVPQLVPRRHLQPAIALNSAGLNVSRAIGPALAGLIILAWGLAAPFWLNALTTLGVIAALVWWQPAQSTRAQLPPERFGAAIRAGLRHARHNPHLRATLWHALGFLLFASAYWALLPLLARNQIAGGPALYGLLLGAIGAGAVAGAFALPTFKRWFGVDMIAAGGSAGTALALVLFALARDSATAFVASILAGVSWIALLATLNVSAQVALPSWVRGRGLSVFGTVMFGSLALGSLVWGQVAALVGLPITLLAAAAGVLAAVPLLWRFKLQTGADVDLTPSMHWPEPVVSRALDADRGPVLVTVEYRVPPEHREAFLAAVLTLAEVRRRDGAFDWGIYEDAAREGRFVETFLVDSWMDHLRQHERVTNADRVLQDAINRFQIGGAPRVTHLIAVDLKAGSDGHP
jgi:MFS family permease